LSGIVARVQIACSYEQVVLGELLAYIADSPRVVVGIGPRSSRRPVVACRYIVRQPVTGTNALK